MELVGRTLGDFHIEGLLGKGSMARVYQARQISLRRHIALKVLEEGIFTPGNNVKRFLREAEALAKLEHANIVPVYAAGEQLPYYFFAMRMIRGGTLEKTMRSGVKIATALEWAADICRGLAFAHSHGIVHRDLKPTNVLIQDGVALLSDFGLARLRDASTVTQLGHLLGTPLYMAPEQTLGDPAGPPADCFALGVMLYQLVTGHHPFLHDTKKTLTKKERRTRLFQRIQNSDCSPPSRVEKSISPDLDALILRALARKPQDRFCDGHAMLAALEKATKKFAPPQRIIRSAQISSPESASSESAGKVTGGSTVGIPIRSAAATRDSVRRKLDHRSSPVSAKAETKPPVFVGRYRIVRELGHGGQGVVYEAHDPILDRGVALKVLRRDTVSDAGLVELFWHEARIAARLSHPHIITIYDFGVENECEYLTMQLIDGPSLDLEIEKRGRFSALYALETLIQAADALAFAHAAEIIHLDVKPGNILLQPTLRDRRRARSKSRGTASDLGIPHVVLTDFTMSRMRHALSAKQTKRESQNPLSGTVPYSAPEQFTGDPHQLGPPTDVFALGIVLHEMLTGRKLFASDDPSISRERVLNEAIPFPSSLANGIPKDLDALCMKMLTRSVSDRLQSCAEVISRAELIEHKLQR